MMEAALTWEAIIEIARKLGIDANVANRPRHSPAGE
jgi:hypothetical protein